MTTTTVYGSRPVRQRRSNDELAAVRRAIVETLRQDHPQSVRGLFYQLTVQGAVAKTEPGYKGVSRLTTQMRRAGTLRYDWLADGTRWMRKPRTFTGLAQVLERTAETYRRDLWDQMPVYVEIWIEKEALAGVIYPVTAEFDVPLMVTRGYPSLSFLYNAGVEIAARKVPAFIYYLGDHDPSGVNIAQVVERDLKEYAGRVTVTFERVAVTPEQIRAWDLPTRPTKKSDSRAKSFGAESVELDAIPANQLRAIVRQCIEQHIDPVELARLQAAEQVERESLRRIAWEMRADVYGEEYGEEDEDDEHEADDEEEDEDADDDGWDGPHHT